MNTLGISPVAVEKGIELGIKIGNKIKEAESAKFDKEYAERYYEIYGRYPDASMYRSGHRSGVVGAYDNSKFISTSYNNATKVENLNATINSREKKTANNKVLRIALIAIVIGGGLMLLTR